MLCAAFALVVFAGYALDVEPFYRPFAGGSATHPLTAACILLLGLGLGLGGGGGRRTSRLQFVLAGLIGLAAVMRLADILFDTAIASAITPFAQTVTAEIGRGLRNAMGVNSAIMLVALSIALGFKALRMPRASQVAAFLALGLPMVSLTGYAYGIETFYGHMSILTTTVGFLLSVAMLAMTAHRGALRALLSPHIGGRIARVQAVLGYVVPFLLGLSIVRLPTMERGDAFGIFVVAVSWFAIFLICFSAIVQEQVDRRRRMAERALVFSAMNDPLTHLPNRRRFFEVGLREMERTRRTGTALWVLMIDIDHFKRINDTAGHAMGDQVLVAVGRGLSRSVRITDLAGRLGGEEFAVLLIDGAPAGAARVAESIRSAIEAMTVEGWTDRHGPVTTSVGCASSAAKETFEDVLSAADEALYRAKEGGRNRVVIEDDPVGAPGTSS